MRARRGAIVDWWVAPDRSESVVLLERQAVLLSTAGTATVDVLNDEWQCVDDIAKGVVARIGEPEGDAPQAMLRFLEALAHAGVAELDEPTESSA